jgi:hypothetical protein
LSPKLCLFNAGWFKYDRDKLWHVYTQSIQVIFEPPCNIIPPLAQQPDSGQGRVISEVSRSHTVTR